MADSYMTASQEGQPECAHLLYNRPTMHASMTDLAVCTQTAGTIMMLDLACVLNTHPYLIEVTQRGEMAA